jgi:alginate O-acetyltransferase complex protein AlgI
MTTFSDPLVPVPAAANLRRAGARVPPLLMAGAGVWLCLRAEPRVGMWVLAFSLFLAAKWAMWWPQRKRAGLVTSVKWFFLWPGMHAGWLRRGSVRVKEGPWRGMVHTAIAAALLVAAVVLREQGLAAAWLAMFGLINALHFGLFHVLACYWQRAGRHAPPLVDRPLASTTLTEFWGRRWNTAFRHLSDQLVFRPVARRHGAAPALLAAFLASGLVHDLVISLPARGGWGFPTLYFLLQAAAILLERCWNLHGRLWVWGVTGLPLPLCFHPPFCERVILPLLDALTFQ